MKKVISISLGSSERDHQVETEILGEHFIIERIGTDGDKARARQLFTQMDGEYDAFGLGGIDLYIYSGNRRFTFRDAKKLIRDVHKTPVVDGSGLKNTLERKVIRFIHQEMGINLAEKRVLMVSGVDRFGMAETFCELGSQVIFGDLIFALGITIPLHSLKALDRVARILAPIITQLPFELVYPTGNKERKEYEEREKFVRYYQQAEIIAGDFHLIKKYMPADLAGKIIITNTVTIDNLEDMRQRGVKMVVTTTPELNGRSFGTNVIEGVLISLAGKDPEEMTSVDYNRLLNEMNFTPRVINFDQKVAG